MNRPHNVVNVRDIERHRSCIVRILVIATLDTKADEVAFLAEQIERQGAEVLLMDTSTSTRNLRESSPVLTGRFCVMARAEVAKAGGMTMAAIAAMERGKAVSAMRDGVTASTLALANRGQIDAAICIGGAGAHLAGPAFQQLDLGFPKLVVSPLASGSRTFEPFVGLRDVAVLHSVADVNGINAITSRVYREAAGYIVGAARAFVSAPEDEDSAPAIAISMNGNTTPGLTRAMSQLEGAGYSCVMFHANGTGGRAFEDFVASGRATAALDYTTTELSARLVGGLMDPGPNRMETAGRMGIPQVLVPGCIDFITSGRWDDTEREFPGRRLFGHNPELTLVRLNRDEMREMGSIFASKANLAQGPTVVCVPTRGLSVPDTEGGVFWDPEADAALVEALQQDLTDRVRLVLVEAHINDNEFVDAVIGELTALVNGSAATLGDSRAGS